MDAADGLFEVLKARRSIRRFRPDPVEEDTLRRVVEAAAWAPSAGNRQGWEFLVVRDGDLKARLARAVTARWKALLESSSASVREMIGDYGRNFDWFDTAPVLVVVTAKRPERFFLPLFGDRAADIAGTKLSAAMACQNLMLAATALGLGSCCLTGPLVAHDELASELSVGPKREIVCAVALGWPDQAPRPPDRRPTGEILRFVPPQDRK